MPSSGCAAQTKASGLQNIAQAYQAGYNTRAQELGIVRIHYADIKKRIGAVLPPAATAEERTAIRAAL
ncbi:hypothetical protein QFZ65_002615 [Arthrobacter sp. B3I9]|nr:hypothetical protein [Arthrobacter sp. B3I9]